MINFLAKNLTNIKFWLITFFIIRLIGITNPPIETSHNWRQTVVTMVARNFLEVDNNILYPRIDITGEKSGITGMEFPLLNYLIYIVSNILGYEHWYGRLINLIFSTFGIWYFYKILNKYFTPALAFNASIILLCSLWFSFSRKIMPDTFSMSFILASIYYGSNYLDAKSNFKPILNLLLYAFLLVCGSLSKLPAPYLLIVFAIFMVNHQIPTKRKIIFFIVSTLTLIPTLIWYFYWVPYLVETYGFFHFFMGKSLMEGITDISNHLPQVLDKFYNNAFKYIGFIFFIYGLALSILKKQKVMLYIFGLCFLSFLVIVLKAGAVFAEHNYYIIPFVPVMALIVGYAISNFKNKKIAVVILILIGVENLTNQQHDFFINQKEVAITQLEIDLNKVSEINDLIAINSINYPTPMYFAHRKGWLSNNQDLKDVEYINGLRSKGLKCIVILKKKFGTEVKLNLPIAIENEDYCIYKV